MSRLFVSYGHESDAHRRRVLELARRLRADGIEVVLDEDPPPSAGWIKWMEQQVEQADHILVIPGPHYLHGFRQHGAVPSGARYEGMLISAELERCGGDYRRFLVGLYDDCARVADLPAALYSCPSRFRLDRPDSYPALLSRLAAAPPPASAAPTTLPAPAVAATPPARDVATPPVPAVATRRAEPAVATTPAPAVTPTPAAPAVATALPVPPLPASAAEPPLPPDRCLGRDTELAELTAALLGQRAAVLVLGGPGIGKTTLTRQVAASAPLVERFADRRWFVELETAADAATLRTAIVQATGGNPADPAAFDHALARLREAPALLVLDNLETPWEADALATEQTLRRLAALPGLTLLASLRGNVAPPSPAWSYTAELPPLPDEPARALFRGFARKIRPDDPHLPRFLQELGGVPLAIELAAQRAAPRDTLAELWQEWQRRRIALARRPDVPEGRRTSVLRSIDLSLHSPRLREQGRRLVAMLGALPAGMADADRAVLLGDDAAEAAGQVLAIGLAVTRDGRLDLLPPVRDAVRLLAPETETDSDRRCRHYLDLVRATGVQIGRAGGAEAVARLAPEIANLDAVFTASHAERRVAAVAAAWGLHELLRFTGLGSPAVLLNLAAACHAADDPGGEAECDFGAGVVAFYRSDHRAARAAYERALPLFRQVGDAQGEANCIQRLGDVALARSEHDAARAAYQQALPLFRQVGDVLGEANCIKSLGDIALARSEHEAARAAYERALPLFRQVGAVLGEANCIKGLGDVALERSEHDAARAAYQQALPLYRQVGAVLGEANCIQGLGDIARQQGDVAAAREQYAAALALYARIPEPYSIGRTHFRLAELATGADRAAHVAAAREAWNSIDRPDLVASLDRFN